MPVSVVSGEAGSGKSTLMASLAAKYIKDGKYQTVIHFVGAAPGSTALDNVLMRIWFDCEKCDESSVPTEAVQLRTGIKGVFERAGERISKDERDRVVIFIDAINQLDNIDVARSIDWLPEYLPENVRIVISTLPGECLDALRKRNVNEIKMTALLPETCRKIVDGHLKGYNKKLDERQMSILVGKKQSNLPLWLTIACEELRVFGEIRKLDEKVKSLDDELPGLIEQALRRVISDSSLGDLLQAALMLIRCSKSGLTRGELLELLVKEPLIPAGSQLEFAKSHQPFGQDTKRLPDETVCARI